MHSQCARSPGASSGVQTCRVASQGDCGCRVGGCMAEVIPRSTRGQGGGTPKIVHLDGSERLAAVRRRSGLGLAWAWAVAGVLGVGSKSAERLRGIWGEGGVRRTQRTWPARRSRAGRGGRVGGLVGWTRSTNQLLALGGAACAPSYGVVHRSPLGWLCSGSGTSGAGCATYQLSALSTLIPSLSK